MDGMQSSFADPDHYPLDGRGTAYAMAFFCPKHSGLGSYYVMTTKDNQGRPFDGGSTYRLRVPPSVPVKQYWSATVYDRVTRGLVPDMPAPVARRRVRASRSAAMDPSTSTSG